MTSPKRHRPVVLTREKTFATSASAFIETMLTSPTASITHTTDNHSNISNHEESSQANQLVDLQQQTLRFERRDGFHGKPKLVHDHFEIVQKTTTKTKHTNGSMTTTVVDETQSNTEDDWVCPVAVALRRAGYNVPLRPSKSWLERDRKKQALLREQQPLIKEM